MAGARFRRSQPRLSASSGTLTGRSGRKKADVELMRRSSGATLAEIMKLTSWQPHTVSGTLIKKMGLRVESFRSKEKERCYKIKS